MKTARVHQMTSTERLPMVGFSRAVVKAAESALRVGTAPACAWIDPGTPGSVIPALRRLCLAPAPTLIVPPAYAPVADLSTRQSSE